MRALFFHSAPHWSGVARTVAAAARGLAARDWVATVACDEHGAPRRRYETGGLDVVPLDFDGSWIASGRALSAVIVERFIEVVFVHDDREHAAAALAVRLADRGAVIRRFPSGARPAPRLIGRLAAQRAPTGYLYEHGEEGVPAPRGRLLTSTPVRLGVALETYDAIRPAPRPSVGAGASSRLIVGIHGPGERGRSATLLRTVAMLAPRHPELRVAMIGPGSDAEELRMHAAALKLTRAVAFLGERDDELAIIRAADVAWVTAEADAAAWAFLDCMALRVPIVAERTPQAQRYVADGIAGMLLPPAEPATTAATVAAFLAQDDRRAAMGAAGRTRAGREFTEASMIDAFERAALAARERTAWTV